MPSIQKRVAHGPRAAKAAASFGSASGCGAGPLSARLVRVDRSHFSIEAVVFPQRGPVSMRRAPHRAARARGAARAAMVLSPTVTRDEVSPRWRSAAARLIGGFRLDRGARPRPFDAAD